MPDLVTTSEVAGLRGLATADAARTWLSRNPDIICAGRDLASGEKLWPRCAVLAKPRRNRGRPTREQNTMWSLEFAATSHDQAAGIVADALGARSHMYQPAETGRLGWQVVGGFEALDAVRRECVARGISSAMAKS